MPIADTMCFDAVYEENLQMDEAEKQDILRDGLASWMFVDGMLAGEIYGVSAAAVDEDVEDLTGNDSRTIYCYSTTILPAFQGKGLSKILVARWNGMAAGAGFDKITGHATSPAMVRVRAFFGARFGAVHHKWYDTDRTAHFYEQTP